MTTSFCHCDFHVHTELSGERQALDLTLERLFTEADALGLTHVGYTEHWKRSTQPDLFLRIRDEVERLQPRFRVKVFVSAEIDVLNSKGDLSCDIDEAEKILDYVSVAISHYGSEGVEQLLPDRVDDTVAMIKAVCRIPADVYADVMRTIVAHNKVVDYPSVRMAECWLKEIGLSEEQRAVERKSFEHFTNQLVLNRVRLAPGSDAHNTFWRDGPERWFGNNERSLALLESYGYDGDQLWYCDNR